MYISRTMTAAMAVALVVIIGVIVIPKQTAGPSVTGSAPGAEPSDAGAPGQAADPGTGANGVQSTIPGSGLSPISMANDAARKANAKRVQTAVAVFCAENDRYPQSLAEIPPEMLGITADPAVYRYSVTQNPYGFRLEVVLEGNGGGDPNVITEGGVVKYVYVGQ